MVYSSTNESELMATRRQLIRKGLSVSLIGWNPETERYEFDTL